VSYLIAGAGPAGLAAVDTVREFGDGTPITLVSDETPYSRMVLPYLMDGTIPEEHVYTASEEYLASKGVEGLFGKRVASIDGSGAATLDDGTALTFEKALIATGSSATRPPIPGADGTNVFNLWTLVDAKNVLARRGGEVVVVGAGFIAFTCLDALIKLASKVTVIEVEDRILPRMVDAEAAALVRSWLEERGVEFLVGVKVAGIEDAGGRKRVSVEGGHGLDADVVVTATGIKPNLDFVEGSGLDTDFGIRVDSRLGTSLPNVFAAGDVAQGPVIGGAEPEVHAIEPTAIEHGRVAGANLAGAGIDYWGSLLINIVSVQKLQIASFGNWSGTGGEVLTIKNPSGPIYRKLVFNNDTMVGATLLGRPDDVAMLNDMGMVKGLIQTRAKLGEWRKYLDRHPLDVRRPYVASRAADELLRRRLLGRPSSPEGYRYPDPGPKYWEHHELFVGTKPKAPDESG
jgi:NADPH-dependent 2,4-dienoyl-CoA reductase/sulfur reductase-like enzyme